MRHSYLFIIAIMLAVMTPRIAPADKAQYRPDKKRYQCSHFAY